MFDQIFKDSIHPCLDLTLPGDREFIILSGMLIKISPELHQIFFYAFVPYMKGSNLCYFELFLLVCGFVTACSDQNHSAGSRRVCLGSLWQAVFHLTFLTGLIMILQLFHSFQPRHRTTQPLWIAWLLKGKSFSDGILRGLLHSL